MEGIKIHPKKSIISVFIALFASTIMFSMLFLTVSFKDFLYCMLIGTLFSILCAGGDLLIRGIVVENSELIIKTEKFIRYKIYRIKMKDIYKLERSSYKALGSTASVFQIFFKEDKDEMVITIPENIYFDREIQELFKKIETIYKIPLIINEA